MQTLTKGTGDHAPFPSVTSLEAEPTGPRLARGRRIGRVGGLAVTLVLVFVWVMVFRPASLGGPATYIGVSGVSMTPKMQNGDLAVVEKKSSYKIGDIIAYRIPAGQSGAGSHVIH